jgi:hypothetical protein
MANHTPAFPLDVRGTEFSPPGMDLRDYFAAHVLQGLLANPEVNGFPVTLVAEAYEYANQMMVERGKTRWPNGVTEVQMGGDR